MKFLIWGIALSAGFISTSAYCETKITLFHTSDIHGHFTNLDSPIRLGGIARLKTKYDFLRQRNQNSLLLDSGDWTEGTIFYTLNSGEANHRMMEAFGYDAIVLGNHEWLVGPKDLYEGFETAEFKIPVLAANINLEKVPADIHLDKYFKPYIVKEVGGKKIGIIGLSTFELIYDSFFEPAEVTEPIKLALKYTKILREQEKCDVVILLTHTGIHTDKKLAESVPGIDIILGGHSHILTKKPVYTNGIPIVHIGTWAQYLGEYEITVRDNGKAELTSHKVHQIDQTIAENAYIQDLVVGFQKRIEKIRGNIFNDKIFTSEINLPLGKTITEDVLGNWAVDSLQKVGKTETAFDVGQYFRRSLFQGVSSTVDFFNMFPHIFDKTKNKNWTVFTAEVKGHTLEQLINLMVKAGVGVRVSNATYRIDGDEKLFVLKNFRINKKFVDTNRYYQISATQGILQAFDFLKKAGADVGVKNLKDTGVEAWQAIKNDVVARSPITPGKAKWEGRVRTVQPDVYVPLEQVVVTKIDPQTVKIRYKIINSGLKKAVMPSSSVKIDLTPLNSLDEKWLTKEEVQPYENIYLKAGQTIEKTAIFTQTQWREGFYPVEVSTNVSDKEYNKDNNKILSYFWL